MQFWQLLKINIIMLRRNRSGLFWTLIVPAGTYVALSILPIGAVLGDQSYSSFLLPGIIALTVMQGGIYTLAYWMTDQRNRGVLRQLSLTPVRKFNLLLSLIVARSLVMLLQALVITLIGVIFFDAEVKGSVIWAGLFVVLGGFVFLPIGLLISTFANSYDAAAPITAGIGLPLTFLGNVFYPIQLLPGYLMVISKYLPLTFLADALRKIYLQAGGFYKVSTDLFWMLGWIVVIFAITLWRFRIDEQ